MNVLVSLAAPFLKKFAEYLGPILAPVLEKAITDAVKSHLPDLSGLNDAVKKIPSEVDRITNLIPGNLDDQIIDPVVAKVVAHIPSLSPADIAAAIVSKIPFLGGR